MAFPKRFRTGGSSFTLFEWNDVPIARAQMVTHTSPQPVGPGATAIQPLDARHPEEIITPAAVGMGTFVLRLFEIWGGKVWDQFVLNADDLVDIFVAVANSTNPITIKKYVIPPGGSGQKPYFDTYDKCVIANVEDGEEIQVGTMEVLKQLTINYASSKRSGGGSSLQKAPRLVTPQN